MKKTIFIAGQLKLGATLKTSTLIFLIVLLLFPTVVSAKAAQSTFWPLGISEGSHTYNNIPFQIPGAAGLYARVPPPGDPQYGDDLLLDTYTFGENTMYKANKIHFINHSAWVLDFPDGTVVGQITVCYKNGDCDLPLDLIIGVNTAEWAYDRPGNEEFLGHTPPDPAYSFWVTDDPVSVPYLAHYFYASVEANPEKILDRIELELILGPHDYAGVNINAITVETPEAPPKVAGAGVVPCEDEKKCIFGLIARWKEGEAWPTAHLFFMDLGGGLRFIANDIRRFGNSYSDPGAIFLTGWGKLNGEDGYRFNLWVEDNGNPGAGNDSFRINIFPPIGDIYELDQLLLKGNIKVKTN